MGRKAGITFEAVVEAAAAIADRDGLEAATLTAVAAELGIRTPSLYNHVDGLRGLRRALAMDASGRLASVFEAAVDGRSGAAALRSVAHAYRRFAHDHPGLYDALLPAPAPGEDDELYAAMARPVQIVVGAVGRTDGALGDTVHVIRALRSLLHGFVDLEANRGFGMPVDIETSFDRAVELLVTLARPRAESDRG